MAPPAGGNQFGAACGALVEQIRRLTPDQWRHERAQSWRVERKHNLDHMKTIAKRLRGWREA